MRAMRRHMALVMATWTRMERKHCLLVQSTASEDERSVGIWFEIYPHGRDSISWNRRQCIKRSPRFL